MKITHLGKGKYYGFSLDKDKLFLTQDNVVHHNSGKSVLEQNIIGHVSRYPDKLQLVGVDCKRVEFGLLKGVKGVKGVALDPISASKVLDSFQSIMMDRFKFMEQNKVSNIYKIKDLDVDYYELFGETYQFDELFTLTVDLEKSNKDYKKLIESYPNGRMEIVLQIKDIYEALKEGTYKNPELPQIKGYSNKVGPNTIRKTTGKFKVKALICLIDELNELMTADDYRVVESVRQSMGSIARLGRAAGVHLALAAQKASGSSINSDLMNNIQMRVILGLFDSGASMNLFEKDISHLSRERYKIKGRGFVYTGDIIECQTYYSKEEDDWVFDDQRKDSYENPIFIKQKEQRGEPLDTSGFIEEDIEDNENPDLLLEEALEKSRQEKEEVIEEQKELPLNTRGKITKKKDLDSSKLRNKPENNNLDETFDVGSKTNKPGLVDLTKKKEKKEKEIVFKLDL